MSGYFFTFEGPEGAGKTTIINMLQEKLIQEGFKAIYTREPGGIAIAEQIRSIILNPENIKMDGRTEALLYAAARRQHLVEKVVPALNNGEIVLCDRFIDSSLAYQGYAREIGIEEVLSINEFAINGLVPNLTIYFDIDPQVGLQRIKNNNTREVNRLDMEKLEFHLKVRDGYIKLAETYQERIRIIDAERSIEDVYHDTVTIIKKYLLNKQG